MRKFGLRINSTLFWFTDKTKLLDFISMMIEGQIGETDYNGKETKNISSFYLITELYENTPEENIPEENNPKNNFLDI